MTPEQTSQVFGKGRRFSLSALQAGQGSGLGLFVCKIIAQQHHAMIRVTSPGLGLGSTYTLDLPVFAASAESVQQQNGQDQTQPPKSSRQTVPIFFAQSHTHIELHNQCVEEKKQQSAEEKEHDLSTLPCVVAIDSPATHSAGASVTFGPTIVIPTPSLPSVPNTDIRLFTHKRILVVDDAPSNRKMLVRVLAKQGHVCEQAHDGQVAVDMVQAAESGNCFFDMILMDYEMPVMNGPTATAKLRELGVSVPVVGVTGNVLPSDVEYFMAQGADAVLPKPLQLAALEAVWKKKVEEEEMLHPHGDVEV